VPSRLTVKQLSCFVAVAEEGHFRRAAQRLHMTQPPLTQRIQAMERDLGVQLFMRTNKRVELTQTGRLVLAEAQAALVQIERVQEVARQAESGEMGTLRLAFVIAAPFLPGFNEATRAFQRDYPRVVFEVTQANSGQAIEALRQRKVDMCVIRRLPQHLNGFEELTVAHDRLMLVLPATHPRALAEKIPLCDVADERFIIFPGEQNAALYRHIMDVWARAGYAPRVAQTGENGLAILTLVAAGFGIAMLPSTLDGLRMPNVVWKRIDMDDQLTTSSIIMLYRTEALNEKIQSRFVEYVQQHCSVQSHASAIEPVDVTTSVDRK
jgi:DNA-binding transcriptional LysR family regulator